MCVYIRKKLKDGKRARRGLELIRERDIRRLARQDRAPRRKKGRSNSVERDGGGSTSGLTPVAIHLAAQRERRDALRSWKISSFTVPPMRGSSHILYLIFRANTSRYKIKKKNCASTLEGCMFFRFFTVLSTLWGVKNGKFVGVIFFNVHHRSFRAFGLKPSELGLNSREEFRVQRSAIETTSRSISHSGLFKVCREFERAEEFAYRGHRRITLGCSVMYESMLRAVCHNSEL